MGISFPNLVHYHWEGEKKVKCRNELTETKFASHSFKIDAGSLSVPGDLCRFTFSRADETSAIDNLMLFDEGASKVGDIERDLEVTSTLLKVEKKGSG